MRRSMHSLIVALLCLTLFVDSAKACWWLRQHRSRSQVCRPVVCQPAVATPCTDVLVERSAHEGIVVENHADCCCDSSAAVEHDGIAPAVDHEAVRHSSDHAAAADVAPAAESVVVHGPTMLVNPAPAQTTPTQPAPGATEPASVVTEPSAVKPVPPVAQPMPVATAGPVVLPAPTAAQEPIPTLKPVAPASNEQPMTEPLAKAAAPAAEAADDDAEPADHEDSAEEHAATAPMPAPVDALVGGPVMQHPIRTPKEPNLFDLYGDADDDAADAERPATTPSENADEADGDPADAGESAAPEEPTEDAEATPSAEAEMTDDEAEATDAEASEAGATDDGATDDGDSAEEADAAPQAEPEAAAVVVPDEPMRRWTDETGTHHTRGWLVELRDDRVRILKVNGRHTTVSTKSLSAVDRDYVSAVGARLAAEGQGTNPAPTATAGL